MKHTLNLDASQMTPDRPYIGISEFQFGKVAAPSTSYALTKNKLPANEALQEVFWFDSNQNIPLQASICFSIRFELDIHNSTIVQIRIDSGNFVEVRWFAAFGIFGPWTPGNDKATWQDHGNKYEITIEKKQDDFNVYLTQNPL